MSRLEELKRLHPIFRLRGLKWELLENEAQHKYDIFGDGTIDDWLRKRYNFDYEKTPISY